MFPRAMELNDLGQVATETLASLVAPQSLAVPRTQLTYEETRSIVRANLLCPGDLVFIETPSSFYELLRLVTGHSFDHVAVVLNDMTALHVGPAKIRTLPLVRLLTPSRHPFVLRPTLTSQQREEWVALLYSFVGQQYDLSRVLQTINSLAMAKQTSLQLPLVQLTAGKVSETRKWICSELILLTLMSISPDFATAVETCSSMDYHVHGAVSINDYLTLSKSNPELFEEIPLPRIQLPQLKLILFLSWIRSKLTLRQFLAMIALNMFRRKLKSKL